jgi:hypothetical protein
MHTLGKLAAHLVRDSLDGNGLANKRVVAGERRELVSQEVHLHALCKVSTLQCQAMSGGVRGKQACRVQTGAVWVA